jgi:NhaA family Na+:H+ antiporter
MIKKIQQKIITPLRLIIQDSRSIGVILSICAVVSIVLTNSSSGEKYSHFWETSTLSIKGIHLPHTIIDWINEAFMAIFFFLAGMEIKRELLTGELSSIKKAVLPIGGALGGMIVPACLFMLFNAGTAYASGWGIPMATDIAFSLGIASLLGNKIPVSLKIFLMALAIIDDLGAIIVIALFYGNTIHWGYLVVAILIFLLILLCRNWLIKQFYLHVFAGIIVWLLVFWSGIHATVAGVLFAFTIPEKTIHKLSSTLHIPVHFFILPLFALANTVIHLPNSLGDAFQQSYNIGIFFGLTIGKPVGIVVFCWLMVQLRWGKLPLGATWNQMAGVGMLAGIGFTMSIFITTLAFKNPSIQNLAKISTLAASLISGLMGFLSFWLINKKSNPPSSIKSFAD